MAVNTPRSVSVPLPRIDFFIREREKEREREKIGILTAHHERDVDEELLPQQLGIRHAERLDRLLRRGSDRGVHAQEADVQVVVHLHHAIGVCSVLGDLLSRGREVELSDRELH